MHPSRNSMVATIEGFYDQIFSPKAIHLSHTTISLYLLRENLDESGEEKEYASITLRDITWVNTLGLGGFGRVELVSIF